MDWVAVWPLADSCLGASWDVIRHVADRKGHDWRYALDDVLLRGMGYAPRIAFPDGLASTVRWYRVNRAWREPLKHLVPPYAASAGPGPAARAPRRDPPAG